MRLLSKIFIISLMLLNSVYSQFGYEMSFGSTGDVGYEVDSTMLFGGYRSYISTTGSVSMLYSYNGSSFFGCSGSKFFNSQNNLTAYCADFEYDGNNVCIAVGHNWSLKTGTSESPILRSTNGGRSWSVIYWTSIEPEEVLYGADVVKYANNTWIIGCSAVWCQGCNGGSGSYLGQGDNADVLRSVDGGLNWSGENLIGSSSTYANFTSYDAEYGSNIWVLGGDYISGTYNNLFYSTNNGISWQQAVSPFSSEVRDIHYNGEMWVAVGSGTNTIAYSYNGIDWTGLDDSVFTSAGYCITYKNDMWVAGGYGGGEIAYSYNGISWIMSSSGDMSRCYKILYDEDGTWIATGSATTSLGQSCIMYSHDGINWTGSGNSMFGVVTSANVSSVVKFRGKWYALDALSYKLAYSTDGEMWSTVASLSIANRCVVVYSLEMIFYE